jgi:hypothetical protein
VHALLSLKSLANSKAFDVKLLRAYYFNIISKGELKE